MYTKISLFILLFFYCLFSHAQSPAIHFDGVDDYVQTTFMGVQGNADRTVEAWIKTTAISDPNSGGIQQVIVDYGTFINGQRFTFNVLWNNAIRLEVGGSGISGTIAVNDGIWHHVAAVFFEEGNTVRLYVDGELDTEGFLTVAANTTNSNAVQFGRRIDDTRYFEGEIDEVRMYNYAKTQTEVMADMNEELCELPVGLVGYWKLNEGTPYAENLTNTMVTDYSINANDGELLNFELTGDTSNWTQGELFPGMLIMNLAIEACDSAFVNGEWYFSSQTLTDTVFSNIACDSITVVELQITSNNISVEVDDATISSNETSADSYAWYDCTNMMLIPGETTSSFTPSVSGDYAVILEQQGCIDTSECVSIMITSLEDIRVSQDHLQIIPNPNNGRFSISLDPSLNSPAERYTIYDLFGKPLSSKLLGADSSEVFAEDLPGGVYLIVVETSSSHFLQKLVME
jgi:hypothetical protein